MNDDLGKMNLDWSEDQGSYLAYSSPAPSQDRRSTWRGALQAVKYLSCIKRTNLRYSDRVTETLLAVSLMLVAILSFTPVPYVRSIAVFCDLLVGVTLLMFITSRLGFLNTLNTKQAAIVWDLIIGFALLAIFVVLQLAVVYFVMRYSLTI